MLWTSRTYQHTVLYRDSFNILLPIGYRYTKNHSYAVLVISTTAWQNKVSLLIFRLMSLENLTKNQRNKLSPRAHKRAPLTDLAPAVWDQPRDPQVIIRQSRHLAITRLATSRSLLDTGAQLCFHYYCNPPYVWFWKSRNEQKLNLDLFERKSGESCLANIPENAPWNADCRGSVGECLRVVWGRCIVVGLDYCCVACCGFGLLLYRMLWVWMWEKWESRSCIPCIFASILMQDGRGFGLMLKGWWWGAADWLMCDLVESGDWLNDLLEWWSRDWVLMLI